MGIINSTIKIIRRHSFLIIASFFTITTCTYYKEKDGLRMNLINKEQLTEAIPNHVFYATIPFNQPVDDEIKYGYYKKNKEIPLKQKEVFLTFDDGPSRNNTLKILEILNKNNVKATFFVIGKKAEENPNIIRALDDSGMCITAHTHTHNYSIYNNIDTYMKDLEDCNEVIKRLTNKEPIPFIRFPGGSDNRVSNLEVMKGIRNRVKDKSIRYVDWNVSSTDASAATVAMSQIRDNVISQVKNTSFAVVLMHDAPSKTTTVEALPEVIRFLKDQGYVFRTFNNITIAEEREMIKRGIINR
jgi:peptidoglycan/xylan/chitin deacetylase (PgdA/CDA1 family)